MSVETNIQDGINSRLDTAEEKINEFKGIAIQTIQMKFRDKNELRITEEQEWAVDNFS